MYKMTYSVTIGDNTIPMITAVNVKNSVETLGNTATIEIPATAFKKRLITPTLIDKGMEVSICLGYDDNNEEEFTGYVTKKTDADGGMIIDCEDRMYLFKQVQMSNAGFKNITADTLINKCVQAVNDSGQAWTTFDYENAMKFSYGQFTIENASAYDVLKKIHEETHADFYWVGDVLMVEPRYIEHKGNEVRWSFQKNIDKNGTDLTWKDASQSNLFVEVIGKGKEETTSKNGKKTISKNTEVRVTAGKMGGDKITEKIHGVTDTASLQAIADEIYAHRHYNGFDGSFSAWLIPYAEVGDTAVLVDEEDETRNGKYYITGVDVSFSSNGGIRKINLGYKV